MPGRGFETFTLGSAASRRLSTSRETIICVNLATEESLRYIDIVGLDERENVRGDSTNVGNRDFSAHSRAGTKTDSHGRKIPHAALRNGKRQT